MPARLLLPMRLALLAFLTAAPAAAQPVQTLASPDPQPFGLFGIAVAGVPDANGDGRGDFLAGAPGEDLTVGGTVYPNAGRGYLFSGATDALLHTLRSPNLDADEGEGGFASDVSGVPDVDGDGRGDLLVSGVLEDVGGVESAGRAYLFSGATGARLRTLRSPAPQLFGGFGDAVAGVPDADGDGRGDLLVGAYPEDVGGTEDAGRAYLFSGATGALLRTLQSPNPEPFGEFAQAVAGVPDADGDGRGDLLIGAFREGPGRVYLYSGATGALLRTLLSPNPEAGSTFGFAISGVPDANGDGRGDLLVGAFSEDGGATDAGRAYLFSGATGALLRALESPNPEFDPFPYVSGSFGFAVSGVPDLDGDGRGDLLAGAYGEDARAEGAGRAYLFSGASGDLLATLTSPNAQEDGSFGIAAAGVPDADGDGGGDLFVGAYFEAAGGPFNTGAGRAYAFGFAGPFALTAEPVDPPIVIGAGGGRFRFRVTATNRSSAPQTVEGWAEAVFPGTGVATLAFGPRAFTLASGQTLGPVTLEQTVPATAATGTYTYRVKAGLYPSVVLAEDDFPFVKLPVSGGDAAVTAAWGVEQVGGPPLEGDAEAREAASPAGASPGRATGFALRPPQPNPSAGPVVLGLDLPAPTTVTAEAFDALGRRVAVLHDGPMLVGEHALRWEASALPAGVYAVRVWTGDGQFAAQRVTLAR